MGGTVDQVGDVEIAGTVPVNRIEEPLKLIRVSKVPMRNPKGHAEAWFQNAPAA